MISHVLREQRAGRFIGRLSVCQYFEIYRFSALLLVAGGGLRSLIMALPGNISFVSYLMHYSKRKCVSLSCNYKSKMLLSCYFLTVVSTSSYNRSEQL